MSDNKSFGRVLTRIRKERGYPTAHQFFKSVGGSKALGFSFVSYWDLERNKKLPRSWRIKALLAALGLDQDSPPAKELILAYFRTLSGSDELPRLLAAPTAASAGLPSRELEEAAAHQAQARRSANLTLEQWKLLAEDLVTDITNDVLVDTAGWVTVRELSEATEFKPEAIRKGLKALSSAGLADVSGDKARSRLAGKVVNCLPQIPATAKIVDGLDAHMKTWLAGAKIVDANRMSIRMTKAGMDAYRPHLEKAMNLASIYGDSEANRQESEIYSINTCIYRFAPRK